MKEMNNLISGRNVGEIMSEALFPEDVDFFGIGVSPSFYSALIVTAVLLLFALAVRIFAIPRFKKVPGKFQLLIETLVKFFDNLAKGNSPDHNGFLGTYIFSAGLLVFFGTIIEMFGFRAVMGDLNACVVMGVMSYGVIVSGGFIHNKMKGGLGTLKDFSLPISMSFRLFGTCSTRQTLHIFLIKLQCWSLAFCFLQSRPLQRSAYRKSALKRKTADAV